MAFDRPLLENLLPRPSSLARNRNLSPLSIRDFFMPSPSSDATRPYGARKIIRRILIRICPPAEDGARVHYLVSRDLPRGRSPVLRTEYVSTGFSAASRSYASTAFFREEEKPPPLSLSLSSSPRARAREKGRGSRYIRDRARETDPASSPVPAHRRRALLLLPPPLAGGFSPVSRESVPRTGGGARARDGFNDQCASLLLPRCAFLSPPLSVWTVYLPRRQRGHFYPSRSLPHPTLPLPPVCPTLPSSPLPSGPRPFRRL